jgi:hypothetical protein
LKTGEWCTCQFRNSLKYVSDKQLSFEKLAYQRTPLFKIG